jgi:hypothetical protein
MAIAGALFVVAQLVGVYWLVTRFRRRMRELYAYDVLSRGKVALAALICAALWLGAHVPVTAGERWWLTEPGGLLAALAALGTLGLGVHNIRRTSPLFGTAAAVVQAGVAPYVMSLGIAAALGVLLVLAWWILTPRWRTVYVY